MLSLTKRLMVASVFVIPAITGLTALSAGASPGAQITFSAPRAIGPNSDLSGLGHSVVFDPTSITGDVVSQAHCTSSDDTFSLTNDTPKAQKITQNGAVFMKISAGEFKYVCISAAGTEKYGLMSDPSTKLKVTVVAGT